MGLWGAELRGVWSCVAGAGGWLWPQGSVLSGQGCLCPCPSCGAGGAGPPRLDSGSGAPAVIPQRNGTGSWHQRFPGKLGGGSPSSATSPLAPPKVVVLRQPIPAQLHAAELVSLLPGACRPAVQPGRAGRWPGDSTPASWGEEASPPSQHKPCHPRRRNGTRHRARSSPVCAKETRLPGTRGRGRRELGSRPVPRQREGTPHSRCPLRTNAQQADSREGSWSKGKVGCSAWPIRSRRGPDTA